MKTIALKGDENSGKSHTVNIIYSFLLRDGFTQLPNHFKPLGEEKHEDIRDILMKEGLKVGILGMGDLPRELKNQLNYLVTENCDVIICACRSKPNLEKIITDIDPIAQFVPKTPSLGRSNDRIVNVIDAEYVISLI